MTMVVRIELSSEVYTTLNLKVLSHETSESFRNHFGSVYFYVHSTG